MGSTCQLSSYSAERPGGRLTAPQGTPRTAGGAAWKTWMSAESLTTTWSGPEQSARYLAGPWTVAVKAIAPRPTSQPRSAPKPATPAAALGVGGSLGGGAVQRAAGTAADPQAASAATAAATGARSGVTGRRGMERGQR